MIQKLFGFEVQQKCAAKKKNPGIAHFPVTKCTVYTGAVYSQKYVKTKLHNRR